MTLITIQGTLHDPNGTFPTAGGTISFLLSDWFIAADNHIVLPKTETASVSAVDGTFSIQLESTKDATPSTRSYGVSVNLTFEGVVVQKSLGSITLENTPSPQQLYDLLTASSSSEALSLHTDREAPNESADGSRVTFTVDYTPVTDSEMIFVDGSYQVKGAGLDYTISGKTITFGIAPMNGAKIEVFYRKL